jgi:hypothetical protein
VEPADDDELLVVLLAEVGASGADVVEQHRHHRRYAVEVTRPRRALPAVGQAGDVDAGGVPRRVHLFDGRGVDKIGTDLDGERHVALQVAGVTNQVVRICELGRVEEDADDDPLVLGRCLLDQ